MTTHRDNFSMQLYRRLAVPCTPTELAATFDRPAHLIRAFLAQMKRQGRVRRTDKAVPSSGARGRPLEFLWVRC